MNIKVYINNLNKVTVHNVDKMTGGLLKIWDARIPNLVCRNIPTVMRDVGRPKGNYGDQNPRKPDKLDIYLYLVSLVVADNGRETLCY